MKVIKFIPFLLTFLGMLPSALAAEVPLSFNLTQKEDLGGDYPLVFYTFRSGTKLYTFCPPASWRVVAEANGMTLSGSEADGEMTARFRPSTPAELALANPEQIEAREPELRKILPAGVSNLQILESEAAEPLPVFGGHSAEVSYRYNFYGRPLKTCIIVCQLGEQSGFTLVITGTANARNDFVGQMHRVLGAVGIVDAPSAPAE